MPSPKPKCLSVSTQSQSPATRLWNPPTLFPLQLRPRSDRSHERVEEKPSRVSLELINTPKLCPHPLSQGAPAVFPLPGSRGKKKKAFVLGSHPHRSPILRPSPLLVPWPGKENLGNSGSYRAECQRGWAGGRERKGMWRNGEEGALTLEGVQARQREHSEQDQGHRESHRH